MLLSKLQISVVSILENEFLFTKFLLVYILLSKLISVPKERRLTFYRTGYGQQILKAEQGDLAKNIISDSTKTLY